MPKKPLSDHFDGRLFFNPTLPKGFAHSRREVLRMLREPRSPWPAWVENRGVPRLDQKLGADEIAITFVNHATFLIQAAGVTILTDPMWSERASPFRRIGPKRVRAPGVPFDDLPAIDMVLLSHNHYDHLDVATLKRLRQRFTPAVLAAMGDGRLVAPLGFTRVHELDWWQQVRFSDTLAITFVPAQHFSARGLFDRRKSLWGGYMIESRGRRIYFGGDTGYSTHFANIRGRLGSPDIAMLGIGAYEPRWFMQDQHMNPSDAVKALSDCGAAQALAHHHGTFQLADEAIEAPVTALHAALDEMKIPHERFVALKPGQVVEI
jgi:L-ascorbate metabolism protein UlaG (beta-lactamase superfamily)